ncbi:unnamed protein product, partial [Closterium sp. NIES-54]
TTLAALGFVPSSADPSLFLRTDTTLPSFYVLVYVNDLVFATADTEALALDRARRIITLTQSYMVHQVLQRFGLQFPSSQPTPLSTGHSLSAPPSDKSLEPSGPYPELVGCLMYLMTCTRSGLAYPLSLLARYVAPGVRPTFTLGKKTKHIALRYFLARELQQRRQLRLSYMASRANTADVFTNALGSAMCTVDKMLIKGIRSFSPENQAVITFFKPLTLIVGPNGAGKTTIIECLKCATTGELPPNARSGHSFIHDPKVAHITETKGQIKLRFRTAAGKDVVSVRNFSLTQKTSKMEFKAIESVLQTINSTTGERVSLSYRCADMDREIPLLMGVPKAVLENVIFVHQDDANWPLAEPALLKKKFDDIFSATKYTKALEALKKVHKEQAQLIKEMKLKAENLRNILDTSLRLQEGIKADSGHSERLVAQIERLEGQIAERRVRQGEVESGLARLRQLKADLQTQEGRLELLSRQKVQQRANIMSDNDESDEKLEEWRREFEGVVAKLEGSLAKTTRELSELRIQQEAERESSERDKQLVSRLQVEKEVHERDCNERDRCLQELFSKHDLGDVGPVPLANDQAVQLGSRAASRLTLLQEQWDEMKRGQQEEERRRGAEIEAAGAEIVKAEGQLQMAQERKRSSEARRQQVQEAMERSSVDEDGMARLEREEKKS